MGKTTNWKLHAIFGLIRLSFYISPAIFEEKKQLISAAYLRKKNYICPATACQLNITDVCNLITRSLPAQVQVHRLCCYAACSFCPSWKLIN